MNWHKFYKELMILDSDKARCVGDFLDRMATRENFQGRFTTPACEDDDGELITERWEQEPTIELLLHSISVVEGRGAFLRIKFDIASLMNGVHTGTYELIFKNGICDQPPAEMFEDEEVHHDAMG